MKKSLVLMAMAGVALASCVNDVADVAQKEQEKNVKIVFDTPATNENGNGSRANIFGEIGSHQYNTTTYTYPREENFVIFGIKYDNSYTSWTPNTGTIENALFNATPISYDGNVDGWAPKDADGGYYNWPHGKNMAFAAYSPADLTITIGEDEGDAEGGENTEGTGGENTGGTGGENTEGTTQSEIINSAVTPTYGATGLEITGFRVSPDPAKQYDLMFSQRTVDLTEEDMDHGATYYSGIPIVFQHALTSIRFSLQNTSSSKIVITKISLYGIYDTADFSENIENNGMTLDSNGKSIFQYVRGTNVKPKWDNLTNIVDVSNAYDVFAGKITAPIEAQYLSNLLDTTVDAYKDNEGTFHQLLVLPQAITSSATVYVEYTIDGVAKTTTVQLQDALKVNPDSMNETLNETLSEWLMGHRYTYRLWYSEESASKDRIYFSPSSDNWVDAGAYKIEL